MLNLTPHAIVLRNHDGDDVTIKPSGSIARVVLTEEQTGIVCGIPTVSVTPGNVEGLPAEGTPCIVSAMVRQSVPGRRGVYSPDTGPTAIRNDDGQIVAVTRLINA